MHFSVVEEFKVMVQIWHNYCFGGKIARCSVPNVFPLETQTRDKQTVELRWTLLRTDEPVLAVVNPLLTRQIEDWQIYLFFREVAYSYTSDTTFVQLVVSVFLCVWLFTQMWHDVSAYSIVSHSPFLPQLSLPPSSVFKVSSSLPLSLTPCPISLALSVFLLFHMASRPFLSHLCPSSALWCQPILSCWPQQRQSPCSPFIFLSLSVFLISFVSLYISFLYVYHFVSFQMCLIII